MKRICVYCGSSVGKRPEYIAAAHELADIMLDRGISLVYGGASVGIMGELANRMLASGGEVYGVIPEALMNKEIAHGGLTKLQVVKSMHQRKAVMADLSDGFIALPGGLGTLEEIFEVLTWAQLGFHKKPSALLNVAGYYDQLIGFLDHAVSEEFIKPVHRKLVISDTSPEQIINSMENFTAPTVGKWIDRHET
ncbi:TIGR00730 family Rossman fold protein [Aliidiomarina minuta]|uniref:Cytokinin riboside 5'-monophosphate phosphoribohydrolase n=1 Tax=Aliidiomarina minuta TaxID=880057 RepID=A0A432W8R5_9GAMM|nr:TIGR00730 family Rossman fold protein [Aliidiomarina minuta]RUO26530.1 TIGR00730 family Rossman fold protein [Aliidiomarina minuta]